MKKYSTLLLVAFALLPFFGEAASSSYTTPGTYMFTVPAGVTSVTAKIVGGGGGGPDLGSDRSFLPTAGLVRGACRVDQRAVLRQPDFFAPAFLLLIIFF